MSKPTISWTISAGTTGYATDFGATDREVVIVSLDGVQITENTDYTVSGVGDASQSIRISLLAALVYTAGQTLTVVNSINIDPSVPADSMLTAFTSSGTVTPNALNNEFLHTYNTMANIIGGTGDVLATWDLATLAAGVTGASGNIATLTASVATNTSNIASATGDIATNTAGVASNLSNINSNDTDILDLQTRALLQSAAGQPFTAENQRIEDLAVPVSGNDAVRYTDLIAASVTGVPIPDQTSKSGFALVTSGASSTGALSWGEIDVNGIEDSAVVEAKLGPLAVAENKIKGLAVSASKLATNAVETLKIKDGAVTKDKIEVGSNMSYVFANGTFASHVTGSAILTGTSIGPSLNYVVQGSSHATAIAIDYVSAGKFDVILPIGTTEDEYIFSIMPISAGSVYPTVCIEYVSSSVMRITTLAESGGVLTPTQDLYAAITLQKLI